MKEVLRMVVTNLEARSPVPALVVAKARPANRR